MVYAVSQLPARRRCQSPVLATEVAGKQKAPLFAAGCLLQPAGLPANSRGLDVTQIKVRSIGTSVVEAAAKGRSSGGVFQPHSGDPQPEKPGAADGGHLSRLRYGPGQPESGSMALAL